MAEPTPQPSRSVGRSVASASVWVTTGMLAGRLVGIVRELLIADTFGATRDADVAILLVSGPELLVTIAGSGAVGLVLIPILVQHEEAGQVAIVRRLTKRLGAAAAGIGLLAAITVLSFASSWATVGDLGVREFRAAVVISALAVPSAMVVVLSSALLRVRERFIAVAFSTVTFTLPVLLAIAAFRSVLGVAVGVVAGSLVRYGIQFASINSSWTSAGAPVAPSTFKKGDVLAAFGISVLQAAQVYAPLLVVAAVGDVGDVAVLNYGWRILLIPIGLLGSLFAVAAYPSIVRLLHNEREGSLDAVRALIRPVILLSMAVSAWIWVYAAPAIEVVYASTGLDDETLRVIASALRYGAASVPLITIGGAATTVLFGFQQSWNGLVPYLIATPFLVLLAAVLHAVADTPGVLLAVTVYSAVFALSAVIVLRATSGLAVMGLRDLTWALCTGTAGIALALVLRALVPGARFVSVVGGGIIYFCACLVAGVLTGRTRRLVRRPSS